MRAEYSCNYAPVFRSFPHGPVQVKLLTGRGVLHIVHRVLHRLVVEDPAYCAQVSFDLGDWIDMIVGNK